MRVTDQLSWLSIRDGTNKSPWKSIRNYNSTLHKIPKEQTHLNFQYALQLRNQISPTSHSFYRRKATDSASMTYHFTKVKHCAIVRFLWAEGSNMPIYTEECSWNMVAWTVWVRERFIDWYEGLNLEEQVCLIKLHLGAQQCCALRITDLSRMTYYCVWSCLYARHGPAYAILHDEAGSQKACARWVPSQLTDPHKQQSMEVATQFFRVMMKIQAYGTALSLAMTFGCIILMLKARGKARDGNVEHPCSPRKKKFRSIPLPKNLASLPLG